ncbi:hypothetical protein ACFFTN_22975 [Aminobacter aganoensis]|nr:hypothetical protein [Aminobacter aganoensis]
MEDEADMFLSRLREAKWFMRVENIGAHDFSCPFQDPSQTGKSPADACCGRVSENAAQHFFAGLGRFGVLALHKLLGFAVALRLSSSPAKCYRLLTWHTGLPGEDADAC